MHASLYHKGRIGIPQITTLSDNIIKIEGKFTCRLGLDRVHLGITITIYAIPDVLNQAPFLLGNNLLRIGLGHIAYTQSHSGTHPEITFRYPRLHKCKIYHTAPRDLYTVHAKQAVH